MVVGHGIALLMSGDVAKRRNLSRINVVRIVQAKMLPDSRGLDPGISPGAPLSASGH
jgi:hypothetical protein